MFSYNSRVPFVKLLNGIVHASICEVKDTNQRLLEIPIMCLEFKSLTVTASILIKSCLITS